MPQTVSDQVPALSPVLPGLAGPLGVRATSVATTRAHHMLMARDPHTEDGWRLPSCAVPPGDRPVRAGEREPVPDPRRPTGLAGAGRRGPARLTLPALCAVTLAPLAFLLLGAAFTGALVRRIAEADRDTPPPHPRRSES